MSDATALRPDPLLPPNQTALETTLAQAARLRMLQPETLRTLWNPWTCPERILPWLAWALSVDEWDDRWSPATRRSTIAAALEVHRIKGTLAAVRKALAAAGYPRAQVDERRHGNVRNGTVRRDGWPLHGGRQPFIYRVRLNGLISRAQARALARLLAATAPVRCHLFNNSLDFTGQPLQHNASAQRNGTYTRGIVNVIVE